MSDTSKLKQAREILARHGQEHLLAFHGELSEPAQDSLVDQILSVDYAAVAALHRDLVKGGAPQAGPEGTAEPLSAKAWNDFPISERAAMANQGMRALREGKVAAFLVAGGQGTGPRAWSTSACRRASPFSSSRPSASCACPGRRARPSPGTS